jgi:hypothetical protein
VDDGEGQGAKAGWEHDPIYIASHVSQGRPREVCFGARAQRAKIGRSEEGERVGRVGMDVENVSNSFCGGVKLANMLPAASGCYPAPKWGRH